MLSELVGFCVSAIVARPFLYFGNKESLKIKKRLANLKNQ
ncbi:hypothetical protein CZ794_05870 [Psychrobacter sp. JB385]|nr:hypothetical protein CZ794_05870 [Psychrobacter sp. JB385]